MEYGGKFKMIITINTGNSPENIFEAINALRLTALQMRIVLVYLQYPMTHFTYSQLAAMTHTSKSAIGRAIPRLAETGVLEVVGYDKRGKYVRNLFELNNDFRLWDMNA